jgi:hypothetical protein
MEFKLPLQPLQAFFAFHPRFFQHILTVFFNRAFGNAHLGRNLLAGVVLSG